MLSNLIIQYSSPFLFYQLLTFWNQSLRWTHSCPEHIVVSTKYSTGCKKSVFLEYSVIPVHGCHLQPWLGLVKKNIPEPLRTVWGGGGTGLSSRGYIILSYICLFCLFALVENITLHSFLLFWASRTVCVLLLFGPYILDCICNMTKNLNLLQRPSFFQLAETGHIIAYMYRG